MDYATRAPFVVDKEIGVVFESLSGTEFREVSAQLVDFKSGDIARKMLDMGADVAETNQWLQLCQDRYAILAPGLWPRVDSTASLAGIR
jgi:hypothetical protein